jgi:hypothetical protein
MSKRKGQAVRLTDEAYRRLRALHKAIVARGWQVVGVTSDETPTMASVNAMAIAQVSDLVPELAAAKREG